jgi:hypothetical protein
MPDNSLPNSPKQKSTFIRDTEKVLEVASKILMPVLLLVLGTWFNYQMNSNQEKQRALEQQQADKQRRSELVESYIKHLTSDNPMERQLALQIMSLESDRFDVQLVNVVSAYASVAPPAERLTALRALSHATHSSNSEVKAAASQNITNVPTIPVAQTDSKDVQEKAAAINQTLQFPGVKPENVSNAINKLFK